MAKLAITVDPRLKQELTKRADRMTSRGAPQVLSQLEQSVHFLRGVQSRASIALPAFYLFHASKATQEGAGAIAGYPGVVLQHSVNFSSFNTVTLTCRKAFDHAVDNNYLTGARFAKISDAVLQEHANLWSNASGRSVEDAYSALSLLRSVFHDCSQREASLLQSSIPLCQRVGLLKQHASRAAAHLSLNNYAVHIYDCAHVVAGLTLIGEMIRSFDDSSSQEIYFDELDRAAFSAAKALFPAVPGTRLFEHMQVETQARLCWQWGIERGRQMLLGQLPHATGWY